MKGLAVFAALALCAVSASAEVDAAAEARAAALKLEEASLSLAEAETSRNRVKALTQTVQAYEGGLAALREGLRRASIRETQLTRLLQSKEAEIAQLLGVLQAVGRAENPTVLLHPDGPEGTVRAGMILADVTPAMDAEAAKLRDLLTEVKVLRELQEGAAETLQVGLSGAQEARRALSEAISERTDLPRRFTEDPVQTALLIAATETLEGFASGLIEMTPEPEGISALPDISHRKGALPLPVQAEILLRPGEADAAGLVRAGLVLATRPNALVTAPAAATIRYRGPLLDFGNVIVLEPQPQLLFVFAGLETVFGDVGQVVASGAPVGLMGGNDPKIDAILSQSSEGTGQDRTETLYIEVRQGKTPVNPEDWFQTDKDG
ncbi:murein hydrolase activator EnvC family protein [Cognatishimia maritima]|uniref:Septal ring factor EnvC, activator of murein hydrolases AmiA and AmiB n=1 Tax=Cognatishimia maritima TaxID=870908 RepID=A0A1M5NQ50_9RHOB|nr:peptidoglycan DD-metalloendopeptidase family protein [Cognatishimia maritima]SHG91681.1 Septal ring factor EnvC, activator of murein hydrolases AmiA and AmiB [Cognatishimia maritima]